MIRLFILAGLLASLARAMPAQSLSTTLIGSAGAHNTSPAFGSLDWSVGEPMVNTFAPASGPVLSQGFQQVFVSAITGVKDRPAEPDFFLEVFPNPSSDWVNIRADEPLRFRVLSLLGQEIIPMGAWSTSHQLSMSGYAAGTYLLEIQCFGYRSVKLFKLQILP